jgi:hypothetical protein
VGIDKNEQRSRKPSRRVRPTADVADYASVNPEILQRAICTVAVQGGALRLGYTSDGGAYSVGVYGDGDPYTDYLKPAEDIEQYFKNMIEAWS